MTKRSATPKQSLLKVLAMLGLAAGVASVGIAGCHDTVPVEPTPVAAPEAALSTYPTEEQFAEMPSEFREFARIIDYWVEAGFVGDRAYGQAGMEYLANYAKITLPVKLLYNNSEITSTTAVSEETYFLPMVRNIGAVATLPTSGSCGHTVLANAVFEVHDQFLLNKSWLKWGETSESQSKSASQPACSCTGPSQPTKADYDPYSSDQDYGGCESGGDGSSGSGIQYQPGDYTNGETVSWSTGIGNGGSSLCESDAMVDYVCIDYWDEASGRWVEWGCGYITTCGYYT
jgi:hypothetical protein